MWRAARGTMTCSRFSGIRETAPPGVPRRTGCRQAKRVVAVAGGQRKVAALLGAMRGKLINVLVTDQFTAARLDATQDKKPNRSRNGG